MPYIVCVYHIQLHVQIYRVTVSVDGSQTHVQTHVQTHAHVHTAFLRTFLQSTEVMTCFPNWKVLNYLEPLRLVLMLFPGH